MALPLFIAALWARGFALVLNETALNPPRLSLFSHMTATFGLQPDDSRYYRESKLVVINPEDGCLDSNENINNAEDLRGNIVLVKRGDCEFFKKCWEVAMAGGIACVVGNNEPDDMTLIQMNKKKDESRDLDIPCVFVTEHTYNIAREAVEDDGEGTVYAIISHDGEEALPFFPNLMKIVTYLLIVFPAVWALLTIMHFCRRDFLNRRARNERKQRNRRIPEVVFTKELLKSNNEEAPEGKESEVCTGKGSRGPKRQLTNSSCPICLSNFEENTKIKMLPCNHGFHSQCINPWIGDHSDSCPICRTTILDKLPPADRQRTCCPCWQRCVPDHRVRLLSNEIQQPEAPLNPSPPQAARQDQDPGSGDENPDIEDPPENLPVRGQDS